jgi:carboxypeptidase family protein/TonB-dependent receptor-like protein
MYKRYLLPALHHIFLSLLILFAVTTVAFAQESRGTIIGHVTDASGAAMPGAQVRVINTATNVTATATTNEDGNFNVPFLTPGTYRVSAELAGFKKLVRDDVQVRVSETVDLNMQLEIGNVAEVTEISATTPLLDTASTSLGQVIDQRRVQELPILSGNPTELALLAPGVVNVTDMRLRKAAFNNAPSQIGTNGNGQYNNEFTIDGVPNTFASGNSARVAFSPPVYAVREFKIQTSPYDASVGHTIGAMTNLSTISGTNDYHGEVHLWERNAAFDAPNFFNNKAGMPVPVYQDHRYGASIGGPVNLPKLYHGKNKTFFYYTYEGNKWGVPSTSTSTVPTLKERQGDFSDLLKLGTAYQIYDPFTTVLGSNGQFTRKPIAGNILPFVNPVAKNLINLFPLPNVQGTSDGKNNFFSTPKAIEDYYVHLWRIDHSFSEKHRFFARFHYDWWEEHKNDNFLNGNNALILNRINKGVALDDVYVINSKMVLNLRYGLTYQSFPERRASQGFDLTSLGFSPQLAGLVVDKNLTTLPRVTIPNYTTIAPWETGDGTNTSMVHSVSAGLTRLEGRHNLKFGTEFRVYRAFGNRFPQSTAPDLSFNNTTYTKDPAPSAKAAPIGQELATMLLGIPAGTMAQSASYATQDRYFAPYLHDDFKITSKLTLNLGLRYELELPFTERFDRLIAGFAFDQSNPLEAAARANYAKNPIPGLPVDQFHVRGGLTFVDQNGNGRSPFKGEKNNFLPRIGIAWQIGEKTVLRTGFGIFYDTLGVNTTAPIQTGFSQNTPIQASLDGGVNYIATLANPLPKGLLAPLGPAGGLLTNVGQTINFFDPNMTHPYAQRWSLGIQRELPYEFLVEVTYTGNRGTRIPVTRNYNSTPARYLSTLPTLDDATNTFLSQTFKSPFSGLDPIFGANISRANLLKPYPEFGDIMVEESIGYSWYHALQSRVEKRFSKGFTFQLGWSWSKLMEAVEFLNATDPMPYESVGSFDRTHRISANGIWELPIGKGKRFGNNFPAIANFIAGNWKIGGVVSQQSGPALGFGNRIFNGDINDILVPSSERTAEHWLNKAGFETSTAKQLANNIRTFPLRFSGIRGDDQTRWDFSLTKSWPIRERFNMQFRAEVYNAWNNVNFNTPNTDPTSTAFGTITSTSGDARNWQVAFKFTF